MALVTHGRVHHGYVDSKGNPQELVLEAGTAVSKTDLDKIDSELYQHLVDNGVLVEPTLSPEEREAERNNLEAEIERLRAENASLKASQSSEGKK